MRHGARSDDGTNNGSVFTQPRPGHAYCVAKAPQYATDEQWLADSTLIAEAFNIHHETGLSPRELLEQRDGLLMEVQKLKEELDWQNMPNRREPFRGGWEFYINEEWTGIRDAAMGEDVGCVATLMKVRFDPDDERVRVRRVLDDDAILKDLAEARAAIAATRPQMEGGE